MTYLVTAKVTGDKDVSWGSRISQTYNSRGVAGFYPGASAVAFRQATNWASRQGFTDAVRQYVIRRNHAGNPKAKLSRTEEVGCGVAGGSLACWNHPFEVARIELQARGAAGEKG